MDRMGPLLGQEQVQDPHRQPEPGGEPEEEVQHLEGAEEEVRQEEGLQLQGEGYGGSEDERAADQEGDESTQELQVRQEGGLQLQEEGPGGSEEESVADEEEEASTQELQRRLARLRSSFPDVTEEEDMLELVGAEEQVQARRGSVEPEGTVEREEEERSIRAVEEGNRGEREGEEPPRGGGQKDRSCRRAGKTGGGTG